MKTPLHKRRFTLVIALFFTFSPFLIFSASAHSGRTDADGGHVDSESGEYHYHHGYPAHDHYDMDGDGTIDCPYDFDDQTGKSNAVSISAQNSVSGKKTSSASQNLPADYFAEGKEVSFKIILVISLFVVAIIPGIVLTAINYHPSNSLGHVSKFFFICCSVILCFASPLSALFAWVYFKIYQHFKSSGEQPAAISTASNAVVPIEPVAQQISPLDKSDLESHEPAFSGPDSNAYKLCRLIWSRSIIFCGQLREKPPLQSETYLWTAFFYAITKYVRNQDIVDDIYSQFTESAKPYLCDRDDIDRSLLQIQYHYWEFRSKLNTSCIDPRTDDGLAALWSLTVQYAFPGIDSSHSLIGFIFNARMVVNRALNLYDLAPSKEIIDLHE